MSIVAPTLSLGANLPIEWGYYGCWTDYGRRKLAGPSYVDIKNMTQESCVAFCNGNSHPYAGIEYGQECYCGRVIGAGSELRNDTECDFRCPGATDEACGSDYRLNVFYCGLLNYTHTNAGPPGTSRIGCYTDNVYARVLPVLQASDDGMTVTQCTSSCKAAGYSIAGLEFGRECFCGNSLENDATMTAEGCDMTCAGDQTEFCGGAERLDTYVLNATHTSGATSTSLATPLCNPTTVAASSPYVINGGFEQGLANWTAVAYDPKLSTFDVGLTDDALEGCTAFMAVPKLDSTAMSQHFQVSTTLINLQASQNYTLDLAIGHPQIIDTQGDVSDPRYTIRMSNRLLGGGTVCGFSSNPCPLTGLKNSTYTVLSTPFQATFPEESLTVYLSWYNGNFDVPLYLDSVNVRSSPADGSTNLNPSDLSSQTSVSDSLIARSMASTLTTETNIDTTLLTASVGSSWTADPNLSSSTPSIPNPSDTSSSAPSTSSTSQACDRSLPESTRWSDPPPEITNKTLANSGFESSLTGWDFFPTGGTFDITLTNQSLEGCNAVSIRPTTPHAGQKRAVTLRTLLTNLNASHEWYSVDVYIGHADLTNSPLNRTSPSVTMSYRSAVTGDIDRTISLCGFASTPRFYGTPYPCDLVGAGGAQYQRYGMDVRSFYGADRVYTTATEMEILLEIVWSAGVAEVPVFVDGAGVWEILIGSVSR